MKFLNVLLVGCSTGAVAAIAFFIIGAQYQQENLLDIEGESGEPIVWSLMVAVVGFVLGVIVALIAFRSRSDLTHALGYSIGIVGTISLVAILALTRDHVPFIKGEYLGLRIEIKCPNGWQPIDPAPQENPEFNCPGSAPGRVEWNDARVGEDGRWVVPCWCDLLSSRENRVAKTMLDSRTPLRFRIPLPPYPAEKDEQWSPWTSDGFYYRTGEGFSVRARVRRKGR